MVRYLFYTIGDLTYQSPLVFISSCETYGSNTALSLTHRMQAALSFSDTRNYCLLGNSLGALLICSSVLFMRNLIYYCVHATHATCASRAVSLLIYVDT